jgi:carotenoid 1,2-hydratase
VFSPYYAWARGRGTVPAENHVALNVALYGPRARWAMTERGTAALARDSDSFVVGPSSLVWDGTALTIAIDEVAVPLPQRLRGTVRVLPAALTGHAETLDAAGRHRWRPIAPVSRVEVAMDRPALAWTGHGYWDANAGDEPLEDGFVAWTWSRAPVGSGAAVLYDAIRRDGSAVSLALRIGADGGVTPAETPPEAALPGTLWRIPRRTRADAGATPRVLATLEDAPFYARSTLATRLYGEDTAAMHESLSLDRFRTRWVKLLLPFRMPRRGFWPRAGGGPA